jgi:hypothetical protein
VFDPFARVFRGGGVHGANVSNALHNPAKPRIFFAQGFVFANLLLQRMVRGRAK